MRDRTGRAILDRIRAYDRVLLFRHIRPDGDCTGASTALRTILRRTFPDKEVLLQNRDFSEKLSFLGEEDGPLDDAAYAGALGIVLDTATRDRVSEQRFALCAELIQIDHHIPADSYADLEWIEEGRSSVCEMIADLCDRFRDELILDADAASCLYAGMVSDTGRFRARSVTAATMRLAGFLIDAGADIGRVYARLYLRDAASLRFRAYVYRAVRSTPSGVLSVYLTRAAQRRFRVSAEEAGAAISCMGSVRDRPIWIAFIENPDGSVRVRLRSRSVPVHELASRFRGGGHEYASGATVRGRREARCLLSEADALLRTYRETHGDLL